MEIFLQALVLQIMIFYELYFLMSVYIYSPKIFTEAKIKDVLY